MIVLFWYLMCHGGVCEPVPFTVSREAAAIISCESGDGYNFGTYSTKSRSDTQDGGLFQFNDSTYLWLTGTDHAEHDTYEGQYSAFRRLWNDGAGWRHWKSSQPCWGQWMRITPEGVAVWR